MLTCKHFYTNFQPHFLPTAKKFYVNNLNDKCLTTQTKKLWDILTLSFSHQYTINKPYLFCFWNVLKKTFYSFCPIVIAPGQAIITPLKQL